MYSYDKRVTNLADTKKAIEVKMESGETEHKVYTKL